MYFKCTKELDKVQVNYQSRYNIYINIYSGQNLLKVVVHKVINVLFMRTTLGFINNCDEWYNSDKKYFLK